MTASTLPYQIRAKIGVLRLLDQIGHAWRLYIKSLKAYATYGDKWRDCVRPGRRFVRTRYIPDRGWFQLQVPGWEWICPNCRSYSLISEDMMPKILVEWKRTADDLRVRGYERHIRPMPTAATTGCTNCNFLPGMPE